MKELEQFKDATALYLRLSGYTPQLCQYTIKAIDFLDDQVNNKLNASEVSAVTAKMLICLGDALAVHHNSTKLKATVEWAKLREADANTCGVLLDDINGATDAKLEEPSVPGGPHQEQRQA